MRLLSVAITACVLFVAVGSMVLAAPAGAGKAAPAAEWPQWRGPDRDAVCKETGLLASWPEDGPPLAWTIKGLGHGLSSVTISKGRLFTMGAARGESIIAIDLATREKVWTAPVGTGQRKPQGTPTINEGLVYALGTDAELVCVEEATGKEVWRKNLQKDLGGGKTPGWKFAESPYIDGARLICTPGGEDCLLAALDKKTGEVIWKTALPDDLRGKRAHAQYATITAAEAGGVKQYLTLIMPLGLVGVDAKDGKFLWSYRKIANGTANIPTSVVDGDTVFCSTAYGTGAALLKLTGSDAEQQYFLDSKTFQNHHGGFLQIGDYIYGGHGHNAGNPTCIERKTGKIMWQERQIGGGSGSVVAADGHLYFLWQNGQVALIEAKPDGYKLTGQFKLPGGEGPAWPHPVVCGGKLYLRWDDSLYCYDVAKKP